jgi:hypothetical protein
MVQGRFGRAILRSAEAKQNPMMPKLGCALPVERRAQTSSDVCGVRDAICDDSTGYVVTC